MFAIFRRFWSTALVAAVLLVPACISRAQLSFYVDPGNPWPGGWYNAAVSSMQAVVNAYNAYGNFGNGSIYVYYDAGIPTAQSGYGGYGGSIGVGGTYPNVRVLLHESSHWLGTGTYSNYWSGPNTSAIIQQFDGVGAVLNGDGQHYWPYGENYDNESSQINDARHVAIVYALRKDFGIGSFAPPSTATAATLRASDAPGTSGFNYTAGTGGGAWSDNHFVQPGTTYSTGNFVLRTPNGPPSWTFAGESLTVNNSNGSNGGLQYNGSGTSSVVTFKNLNLDGGYVRHASSDGDVFQLSGKVTLSQSPTIDAAQGNINISAAIGGSGSLTKAGPYSLTLSAANAYSGPTVINAGTLRLAGGAPVASYSFDNVIGNTVINEGTGGAAMNGILAHGATLSSNGRFGKAVSLANGGSVDINSPIADLSAAGNWTVSAWVKTTTAGSSILSKGDGSTWTGGNTIFYLGSGTGGGTGGIPSGVRYAGGFYQASSAATLVNDGTWHLVTYVNNSGSYAIYTDAAAQPLSTGNSGFSSADVGSIVRLGVTTDTIAGDGTANFNGLLDNVRVYKQALSPGQIAAVYQGQNLGALPSTSNVSIAGGAVLDVNGVSQTIGSLSGSTGSAVKLGRNGQLTVSSSANTTFAGNISGGGIASLTKSGTGSLTLSGVNTYTGSTTITEGTLRLSNPAAVALATPLASYSFSHLSGNTVINDGSGGAALNGTLNSNGGTGSINANGGPGAGMGALTLNGNGTTVDINSGVTDLGGNSNWTVSAWVKTMQNGATILNKGDGTNWANGYSTFFLGTGNNGGSGGVPDAVRFAGGWLAGSTRVNDNTWHLLTYTDAAGVKTIYVDGAPDVLGQGQFFTADTGSKVRIGFSPAGQSDGQVPTSGSLSGINIYNAALSPAQVAALYGSVTGSGGGLPATTDLTIAAGATLDVNNLTQSVSSLSGSAGSNVVLGSGQLIANQANSTQFAGAISGIGGSLTKTGSGQLMLSGANTYSGTTTVSAGTLALGGSGSVHISPTIVVKAGATLDVAGVTAGNNFDGSHFALQSGQMLKGNGTIVGALDIAAGAMIAPGESIGTLSAGPITLSGSTSTLNAEIDLGNTLAADLLNASGTMTLNGSTLLLSLINAPDSTDLVTPKTFEIVALDGANVVVGSFGTITGLPSGYSATIDTAFTGVDALGRIGDGNDIAVTLSAVPEPSTLALLPLVLLVMLHRSRRFRMV
jgi:fibronectin-binding autotransporter adhesin